MKYLTKQDILDIEEQLKLNCFPETNLIESAGFFASEVILNVVQKKNANYLILVGPGNNGGDGLVIAKWLCIAGQNVSIYVQKTKHVELLNNCQALGIKIYNEKPNKDFDYVVDALFGINQRKPLTNVYARMIEEYKSNDNVIAVDVPTGCDIDTNEKGLYDPAFIVTFYGPKMCCENYKTYVSRSFVPKKIFYHKDYTCYYTYTELKGQIN